MLLLPGNVALRGSANSVGAAFASVAPTGTPQGSAQLPAQEIGGLLGIRIDTTWQLSPAALSALVDRVGGVRVDIDSPLVLHGSAIAAGPRKLSGAEAANYASHQATGETSATRADRLRRVLVAVFAALPADAGRRAATLGSLGSGSNALGPQGTDATTALTAALGAVRGSDIADNAQLVPTIARPVGTKATGVRTVDASASQALTRALFAGATAPITTLIRVQVVNDSGAPKLPASAQQRLASAELQLTGISKDVPLNQYPHSRILVFNSSPQSLALGHATARALGIPKAPVLVTNQTTVVTDAIAILGADYKP